MGASITIINDSDSAWHCRLGSDTKLINLASIVTSSIGIAAVALSVFGFLAPYSLTVLGAGTLGTLGITSTAVLNFKTAATVTSDSISVATHLTQVTIAISRGVEDTLIRNNYKLIPVNESYTYTKLAPLAWKQATCTRAIILNATTIQILTLYMCPIFSGSPVKPDRKQSLLIWLAKKPLAKAFIVASTRDSNGISNVAPVSNSKTPMLRKPLMESDLNWDFVADEKRN